VRKPLKTRQSAPLVGRQISGFIWFTSGSVFLILGGAALQRCNDWRVLHQRLQADEGRRRSSAVALPANKNDV
jgi:hypothetical protein